VSPDVNICRSGGGYGVWARQAIPEGTELIRVPKAAILCPRNCSGARLVREAAYNAKKQGIDGEGFALHVAVWLERSLGSRSKWSEYLKAMPAVENIPLVWGEDTLNGLSGTELEGVVELDREQMALEFELFVEPVARKNPHVRAYLALTHA